MRSLKVIPTITSFDEKSFSKYLDEVSKIKQLTTNEEVELGMRLLEGDEEAVSILVKSNLRFVISVANQYVNKHNKLPDLVTEGNIGLINAARRFDYTKGFKFISYAVWHIRKQIIEYSDNYSRVVRLPINKINGIRKAKTALRNMEQELGRDATIDELYEKHPDISINKEIVEELMVLENNAPTSYDAEIGDSDGMTMLNFLPNKEEYNTDFNLQRDDLNGAANRILSELTYRERLVMEMIYGVNQKNQYTVKEIAEHIGLTSESVRQIRIKTLKKLTNWVRSGKIQSY